jgi:uncharacterized protein (TIGR03067 family)
MKPVTLPVLLLAGGIAAAAPAPLPKSGRPDTRPDLAKMQGEWVVVSEQYQWGSYTTSYSYSPDDRVTITGDRVRGRWPFGRIRRLHVETGPKTIGLHHEGDAAAALVGIYRVRGDTLTLCVGQPEKRRPSSFDLDQADPGVWLVVLRRQR